eukprot:891450-Rhodomonas_salina.1
MLPRSALLIVTSSASSGTIGVLSSGRACAHPHTTRQNPPPEPTVVTRDTNRLVTAHPRSVGHITAHPRSVGHVTAHQDH